MVKIGKWAKFVVEVVVIGFIVGLDYGFAWMTREAWSVLIPVVGWERFMIVVGALCQMNVVVVAYSLRSLYYLWKR